MCSTYVDAGDVVVDVGATMDLTEEEFSAGQLIVESDAVVSAIEHLTHDIRVLHLDLPAGTPMHFAPGQYAELQVPGTATAWRSYSMSSLPADANRLEFIIKIIQGGQFSSPMEKFEVGSVVRVRGPFGQFGIRLSHRPIIMVAGGSGMAPIRSMLRHMVASGNKRPVTFFFGARTERDLYLTSWLNGLQDEHEWFRYVPALSDVELGESEWAGHRGLVTDVLDGVLEMPLRNYEAYLCGPPQMIDAAIATLIRRGCRDTHIYFDRFVPSG